MPQELAVPGNLVSRKSSLQESSLLGKPGVLTDLISHQPGVDV